MPDKNRAREFCMGFVAHSDKHRAQFLDKWEEVVSNFIVQPSDRFLSSRERNSPYRNPPRLHRAARNQIILKDPETHKLVMTYAAKLVRSLFGDRNHEYVQASPVGYEDVPASDTTTRLLRYVFSQPGHFRTFVEGVVDMLLFGTAIIESPWKYEERDMNVRSVERTMGIELSSSVRVPVPTYDDVALRVIDPFDFYHDPGRYRIEDMPGVAKRFRVNSHEAWRNVEKGIWDEDAVREALASSASSQKPQPSSDTVREGRDQPLERQQFSEFQDLVGYEYWGDVPWRTRDSNSRQVITVWNNVTVREEDYPLNDPCLPFHALIINPMQGRFHGISPAEVVRYDQSFADAVKILLAEAIIRKVHPPIAYDDPDGSLDLDKVRMWKADVPIKIRGGIGSIGTLRYDADVNAGFALWQGLVANIQGGSGATGAVQGEDGPDREAATVGAFRLQSAMDRPELAAMVLEEECLPPIAKGILRRYQQFLADTEDLQLRIGQIPESVWIGTIMGDFDVRFSGSRRAMSRQMKLQSFDRLVSLASALPALAARLPLDQLGRYLVGDLLELPEVAAKMSDPREMMLNLMLSNALGQGGASKNGVAQSGQPAGALPAQMSGGIQ